MGAPTHWVCFLFFLRELMMFWPLVLMWRSGVSRCTLFMLLYLIRMCRSVLHAVLWSHISTLMHLLAAEPQSTAGLLFPGQCLCEWILVARYSIVWGWRVSRAGPIPFYWPCDRWLFISADFPFYSFILWVSIMRLWSSDWKGVNRFNRSLPAMHGQPFFNNNNNNKFITFIFHIIQGFWRK